jgi:hypothetical protein
VYCGDIPNAIFLKGSDGNYDNMDIDCDGANNSAGACSNDPSGQGETAFKDTVQSFGIDDLDANIHPYVVFGNEGADPSFSPEQFGMEPLSVMAVVCNNQVVSPNHLSSCKNERTSKTNIEASFTESGATPTVSLPQVNRPFHLATFASPMMASLVTTATIPRMSCILDSRANRQYQAQTALTGALETRRILRTASRALEIALWLVSRHRSR